MGNSSQVIVDLEVTAEEAPERANRVLAWLIAEGVVERELSDSVLDDAGGHRPGRNHGAALRPEDLSLVQREDYSFLGLLTNGVHAVIGRTVFDAGQNGIHLQCAECRHGFEPDASWIDAVSRWYEGDERVSFPCPSCGQHTLLTRWSGPWPWAFGNLGVELWNWPPLSANFIRAVGERLGARIAFVRSRL